MVGLCCFALALDRHAAADAIAAQALPNCSEPNPCRIRLASWNPPGAYVFHNSAKFLAQCSFLFCTGYGGDSMSDLSLEIAKRLPYLRRYARALTGEQARGDRYIRVCLEVLLKEPQRIAPSGDIRLQLYRLFHEIWTPIAGEESSAPIGDRSRGAQRSVEAKLEALAPRERQLLLLTALEGFSIEDAAEIVKLPPAEARCLLATAWDSVNRQLTTTVLVIEDEPIIALDIAGIVRDLGHTVIGIAASQMEAIAVARAKRPGLVLADIHLGEGGSGLNAVNEILKTIDVPVIFVTAYPERLLTGDRPEPTYLVTKPFEADTLKATIFQALSLTAPASVEARAV
jgi:CheY-like chemotaxis protein